MKILKCFADEEVWNDTTQKECLDHTEGSGYWASGSVLPLLEEGHVVHTPFARYKAAEQRLHTAKSGLRKNLKANLLPPLLAGKANVKHLL
jgi:hypothetical protein